MVNRRLLFQPKGKIKGGFVSLACDPEKGIVNYVGELTVGVFFISKTFPFRGVYQVEPKHLLSVNAKTGTKLVFGPVTIVVCDPVGGCANQLLAAVSHSGFPALKGQAVVSVRNKYIDIVSVQAQGEAFGQAIDLFAK